MPTILVTGLNPAWQKALEFQEFRPGQANRASSCYEFGSGKGLNVSMVLRRLGHEVSLLQVVGGINGERLEAYCRQRDIEPLSIRVRNETRVCTTLIDQSSGQVTEVIEPFSVSADEQVLQRILHSLDSRSQYDALVMSGTAPAGLEPQVYLEIARRVKAPLVVLDVVQEISPELLAMAGLLKVNADEYARLEKRGLSHPTTLVTDGPRPARLLQCRGNELSQTCLHLPELQGVRNPIGAGDTVTAYLTHELLAGKNVVEASRQALAAGMASCLSILPGDFEETTRQALAAGIVVN